MQSLYLNCHLDQDQQVSESNSNQSPIRSSTYPITSIDMLDSHLIAQHIVLLITDVYFNVILI